MAANTHNCTSRRPRRTAYRLCARLHWRAGNASTGVATLRTGPVSPTKADC